MSKPVRRVSVLLVSVVAVIIAGCQEQELPSEKKTRLIVAENMQLKKDLAARAKEIERLNELRARQIKRQEEELAKCVERKELLEKRLQQNIEKQVNSVLTSVLDENAKMRDEIAQLKSQIEKLQQQAKDETESSEAP